MNIKFKHQSLILTLLILSICPCLLFAQKGKQVAAKNISQEIKWKKWGVEFSVPSNMKETSEPAEDNSTDADEDVGSGTKTFQRPLNSKLKAAKLELSVNTNSWKGEKLKTEVGGKEVELTPEQMLEIDFVGDNEGVERADSPQIEAKYLEINGQNGIFVVRNASFDAGKSIKPENQIIVIWGTYRIYKGNIERVMMSLEGKRKDLEAMKKIVNSFKFL